MAFAPDAGARLRRPACQALGDFVGHGRRHLWRELADEYASDAGSFHERHYNEFVLFLPYVQRFLYGEGQSVVR